MRLPHMVPRGFLKYYILRLLSQKPMYGYEIMEEIEKRTTGHWRPGPGSIYPTLEWLEKIGYIEIVPGKSDKKKSARPYRITEKGQQEITNYMTNKEEFRRRAVQLKELWLDFIQKPEVKDMIEEVKKDIKRMHEEFAQNIWGSIPTENKVSMLEDYKLHLREELDTVDKRLKELKGAKPQKRRKTADE